MSLEKVGLWVKVRFFASAREIAGISEETLELENGATVRSLIEFLIQKFGPRLANYLLHEKTRLPRGNLQFLIDGQNIDSLKGVSTELRDGNTLAIIPPVGGGRAATFNKLKLSP